MKHYYIYCFTFLMLFILAACNQDDNTEAEPSSEEETTQTEESNADGEAEDEESAEAEEVIEITDASGETKTFEETPQTVAVLDSGNLDILHALETEIVGRPSSSEPVETSLEDVTEIGNPHEPNFEMIAEAAPDVLIAPLSFQQYEENQEAQGVEVVYYEANSVQDIQDSISNYGTLFDKEEIAADISSDIDETITEIQADSENGPPTLLVYGTPESHLAALPTSLSGDILEKVGGENIAKDFPESENSPQYATLSSELIVEQNPEVILLMTHGDPESAEDSFMEEMEENPTWNNLDAVANNNVYVLPHDLFGTNPGTRIDEALVEMQEYISETD